ncbi:MAG: hypothetical protein ACRD9L_20180, partial [Bryobacteraceae bacterium]
LQSTAREILKSVPQVDFQLPSHWDPLAFITFCERARKKAANAALRAAMEIQRAEWQLLFDHCARARKS